MSNRAAHYSRLEQDLCTFKAATRALFNTIDTIDLQCSTAANGRAHLSRIAELETKTREDAELISRLIKRVADLEDLIMKAK